MPKPLYDTKIMLIFAPSKSTRGVKQQPQQRLLILCLTGAKLNAATAWGSGNTPKGIPCRALTARSAAPFYY